MAKNPTRRRTAKRVFLLIGIFYLLPLGFSVAAHYQGSDTPWWDMRRDSSQQAPDPAQTGDAVIQVYTARAARWRGALGVHSWIAVKPSDAQRYQRIEVMGYALRWSERSVRIRYGIPDNYWFGSRPTLLRDLRGGARVDRLIDKLLAAAQSYPNDSTYSIWPGPNSNTFIAWLGRQVPELQLELPVTAIGKDFINRGPALRSTPSATGVQFSMGGWFGAVIGMEEGLELNLAGFSAGIDFYPPALKLPGIGRIGYRDYRKYTSG